MEITIDKIPTSSEEFVALRDKIATTPEGGAVLFAVAMIAYGHKKETGLEFFTIAVDKSRLITGNTYKGFSINNSDLSLLTMQLDKNLQLGNSYVLTTSAEAEYKLPAAPFKFEITENAYSGDRATGKFKVFVKSSGADTPRPITLAVNDKGIWKAHEWSSLIVGVKVIKKPVSDDL